MKIKHVFDLIFSDDNLYEAIQDASKGRRYNKDVLRVQHDIWNVIEQIQQDVRSGKYTIDKYYIFYVYEPKKRMIMSITFYHRIVQCWTDRDGSGNCHIKILFGYAGSLRLQRVPKRTDRFSGS